VNHDAGEPIGAAQTAIGVLNITALEGPAYATAAHDLAPPDHWFDDAYLESALSPQPLQIWNIPLLLVTKGEVRTNPEFSQAQMMHEVFHEAGSRGTKDLLRKWENDQHIQAKVRQ
jgi:hypothetical protein